jgi:hypothetical protein
MLYKKQVLKTAAFYYLNCLNVLLPLAALPVVVFFIKKALDKCCTLLLRIIAKPLQANDSA